MNPFDPYFARVRQYVSDLANEGRSAQVWPAGPLGAGPVTAQAGRSPVVLKEDTAVELGGPITASATFALWTGDPSLVSGGRITLVGPDVGDIDGGTVPFAQITLGAGRDLSGTAQPQVERRLRTAERLPGYMVRSTGGRIWSRISRDAVNGGFSLRAVGNAILEGLLESPSPLDSAEVLFVTSSVSDVQRLERMGAQVRKLAHDLRRERLRETGEGDLECVNDVSCASCPDNEVCTEIRDILVIRKQGERAG
jgi:CO dehydrogenase/acetyl-CoA synthase beta subunit